MHTLSINRIIELKGVIKWHIVFQEAGLNANTMRSAMHKRRELREDEAVAILKALTDMGVSLIEEGQRDLFAVDHHAYSH